MVAGPDAKQVFEAALKLPDSDRAALLDLLLTDMDEGSDDEIAEAWAVEAERRIDAMDRGEEEEVDGDEIIKALKEGRRP